MWLPDNVVEIGLRGTGFFVNDNGTFITADHVVTKRPTNSRLLYHGSIPHNIIQEPIDITISYNDPLKDICIGQIRDINIEKVELAKLNPKIGKLLCLCGYPFSQIEINDYGRINFETSNIRKYWQPTFVIDYWNFPNRYTFLTQHSSFKGMSGGPVFDIKGNVYGMDISHMIRKEKNPVQEPSSVSNGVVLTVEELKSALENISL